MRTALSAAGHIVLKQVKLPPLLLSAAYVSAYVLLDWASFMYAFSGLGITPWNPPPGLSFAFVASFGLGSAPVLFIGALSAEIVVRGMAAPAPAALLAALAPTTVYSVACWLLVDRLRVNLAIARLRDLAWLLAVAALATASTAALVVADYVAFGLLAPVDVVEAAFRYALGDFLGVILTAPLLLRLPHMHLLRFAKLEWATLSLTIVGLLWLVFAFDADATFKHFYVFFIPLAWAAARSGMDGAALASLLIQLGVVAGSLVIDMSTEVVVELQAVMLALAITTLVIGAAVDEASRAEGQRRILHDQYAHLARLSHGVEVGSALAHELTQPLAAVANYVRAARAMIDKTPPEIQGAQQAMVRADAQAMHVGDTLRRLRGYLRHGELQLNSVDLNSVLDDAAELAAGAAHRRSVEIVVDRAGDGVRVLADRVHATQIVLNLLLNALDAAEGRQRAWVRAQVEKADGEGVVTVTDSGPGVAPGLEARLFEPFFTTRKDGMGLGLSVSLSLAQAQGGRLWYRSAAGERPHAFAVALPLAEADS